MILIEHLYLGESLLQIVCFDLKYCKGESSFDQLKILKNNHFNDGQILIDGKITYTQM